MENLALVPFVPEEEEQKEEKTSPGGKRHGKKIITLITAFFSAVSILFYSVSAAGFIKESEITGKAVVRLMIGDYAGGIENVYPLPLSDGYSENDSISGSESDITLERLERLDTGEIIPSVINAETPYDINISDTLSQERVIQSLDNIYSTFGEKAPVVLIIHTHGTEAYADHASDGYRTDGKDGVIGIGSVISDVLTECGINTIHCEIPFDRTDFNTAYYSAAIAIRDYLREYPSISYIIDVHRDSVLLSDGTYYATEAKIDGQSAAKLMFVVGTDYAGSEHKSWRDNLALCTRLEVAAENENPGLMRGLNIRAASFNEQYTSGSMLLEVGSCANTFDEAARSAEAFAKVLADEIIG